MGEFNILTESFIQNVSGVEPQLDLTSENIIDMLSGSASVAVSGGTVTLLMDLGAQKDVDRLDYGFTTVTTSGVIVSYGRTVDNMVTGSLLQVGQALRVFPTTSGFDFPRYFKIQHQIPSGSPVSLNSLSVFNNDEDVNFGQDGSLTSFSLTGGTGQQQEVYELYIRNDGTIATDMYVSLDTDSQDIEDLEKFYMAPTATGTFVNFDADLEVPTTVPWEWGIFDKTVVSADNKLALTNPANPASLYTTGSVLSLSASHGDADESKVTEAKNISGEGVFVIPRYDHSFNLTNVFNNVRTVTSSPTHYTISNDYERDIIYPAWDGDDKIYYMNGKDTAEIQVYEISSDTHSTAISGLPFYNRRAKVLFYDDGDLIAMACQSGAGNPQDVGIDVWRVNISTGLSTQLQDMPYLLEATGLHQMTEAGNYIYYMPGINSNRRFYRYSISANQWEQLASHPTGFSRGLAYSAEENTVWAILDGDLRKYLPDTGNWSSTIFDSVAVSSVANARGTHIAFGSSVYFVSAVDGSSAQRAEVIAEPIVLNDLNSTISGTWLSPVFRVERAENYRRVFVDLINEQEVSVDAGSLGVATFEVRGSDIDPASDNVIESFGVALDPETWVEAVTGDVVLQSANNVLTFSHEANASPYTSGNIYYGFPLGTAGQMQYKFWWNPASNKLGGSTTFSALYIVPYLDTIVTGKVPVRDPDTNQRTEDNYVYLKLGSDADSGGSVSTLEFYNGSSTASFSINASTGAFHEVILIVDWDTGDYAVRFAGQQIGSGNIPAFKRSQLEAQHSIEIFSAAETVDADEKFKYLAINRVGLDTAFEDDRAIPVHLEDPVYGLDGSVEFIPVTVNSPLLPKTEFMQFRFTFRSLKVDPDNYPAIASLRFPPVLKLSSVGVGETKPIYFKYDFESADALSTLNLKLKAWMFTDKL